MGSKPYLLLEDKFLDITLSTEHIVLEIGSERGEGSSEWLYNWAHQRGVEFHSVDVVTQTFVNNPKINFHTTDAGSNWCRDVLPTLNKKIKVLYLDNFDWIGKKWIDNPPQWITRQIKQYALRGVVMNNENSQIEHLLQAQYCLPYMDKESIVIVDDTYYNFSTDTWEGKCAKVMPLLVEHGYVLESNQYFGHWACRNCSYFAN
jgi:hypothetical protein